MRAILLVALFAIVPLAVPASAQDGLRLQQGIAAELEAATPLRSGGPDIGMLGQRPVLVTFFASWCPPCAAEFAELAKFIDEEGPLAVDIVAVNWFEGLAGTSEARLRRMMGRIHPSIAVVNGNRALSESFGGVFSVPAVYLFDPAGNEIFRLGGDRGGHGRHFLRKNQLKAALGRIG